MPEITSNDDRSSRPLPDSAYGPALIGGVAALVLFGAVVAWSSSMSVASAAIAPGQVTVEGNRKAVQHKDGGEIGTVFVREGQLVEKGQKLLQLELSDTKSEVAILTSARATALLRAARLDAERNDRATLDFPPDLQSSANDIQVQMLYQQEAALLKARRDAYLGQISLLRQQVDGSKRQTGGLQGRVKASEVQLTSVEDELASLKPLAERGLISRPRTLALERTAAALRGDIEMLTGLIKAEEDKVRSAEIQIEQTTRDRLETIARDQTENDGRLAEIGPRLTSATRRLDQDVVTAPESGYIYGLAVFGPGAVLAPNQAALEIVPANDELVLSVEIATTDINRVRPGQSARVHILPYRQQYTKPIEGTLAKVSADRFEDKFSGKSFYKGIVKVAAAELKAANVEMTPGMPVQVTIETGKRTILAYFLDPMFKVYDFALKEQ
ncbi:MAG: HlyD family type I secretion periplasmic adaptor subunit [Microvirga sp.]